MSTSIRRRIGLLPAALLVATLLLSSPTLSAQGVCFGPDGLNGPCCTVAAPSLPALSGYSQPGLGICWALCIPGITADSIVSWDVPTQVACAEYTATLSVSDALGFPIMKGTMVLDYTRTWDEVAPDGTEHQVWRFAAKADLAFDTNGILQCPLPKCLPPWAGGDQPTAFFYGYVDYVCSDTGSSQATGAVLVLYHACDKFIHRPGFSDRPGSYHPIESYGIVTPHSAAQPFTPANTFAPDGPLVGEGARDLLTVPPGVSLCLTEDPVDSGAMLRLATGCVCTLDPTSLHHSLRRLSGTTQCINPSGAPGAWTTVAINFPVNPWYHLVSSSIGFWSTPGFYPGNELAWVDEGIFIHQSACTGDWADIKYGGTTRGGWKPDLGFPNLVDQFTDLATNYSVPITGPAPTPILGSIRPTDRLLYVTHP